MFSVKKNSQTAYQSQFETTIENTRVKLKRILQHQENVATIIADSQKRRDPFLAMPELDLSYEDIEQHMLEGVLGWSNFDDETEQEDSTEELEEEAAWDDLIEQMNKMTLDD